MSFYKYYIQEPANFVQLLKQNGPSAIVNRKIEAIVGNPLSIQIFDEAYDLVRAGESDSDVLAKLSEKYSELFNAESN